LGTRKKSFAQAFCIQYTSFSTLSPCIKGDFVTIQIPEEVRLAGLEDCKNHLHGRILLNKGDKPLTNMDLCKKLSTVWTALGPWKTVPLGKGFCEFEFFSLEDIRHLLIVRS